MNIIRIDSLASTNSYLKDLVTDDMEEGTIVVAHKQIAGRGQTGNSWESEAGKNLTFSLLLRPDFLSIKEYFLLSKAIALGIKDCLDTYSGDISIKWPNDIYYRDKKLAGILIENDIMGSTISQSVIGIGININQKVFLSDAPNPVSLIQIIDRETDLDSLLYKVHQAISLRYEEIKLNPGKITEDYARSLYRNNGYFTYKDRNGLFDARIDRVDNDGLLYLITRQGEERSYCFKEVSVVIPHQ